MPCPWCSIQLICKAAGKYVTPYATELVLQLLQSQSELEPAALNYLAFHVEKSGISQERVSVGARSPHPPPPRAARLLRCICTHVHRLTTLRWMPGMM
jgi:hypothetical protein